MKSLALRVAFVLFIVPAAARAQTDTATLEKLRQELIEVETTTERFKRLIPADFDLAAERDAIDRLARKAELSTVDVKVVPSTERPPLVINRLEISGRDPFDAVHFFVSMLRLRPRLAGIESARFDAQSGETVRYVIRLAYPSWTEVPPEAEMRSDIVSMMRRKLERERAVRDDIVATVARLREDPLNAVAVFTKAADEQAIALTSVRIDEQISMEGFVLGAAARAALTASLEKAGLTASRTEWSRASACEAFSVTARPADLPVAELTPASNPFDGDSTAFCAGAMQPAARHVVIPGDAPYFLRLRDVDLHDLFYILNDLLAENFIVDEDVKGRVTLDVPDSASGDDLFRAISSADLFIGPGPLRRVSTSSGAVDSRQRAVRQAASRSMCPFAMSISRRFSASSAKCRDARSGCRRSLNDA